MKKTYNVGDKVMFNGRNKGSITQSYSNRGLYEIRGRSGSVTLGTSEFRRARKKERDSWYD